MLSGFPGIPADCSVQVILVRRGRFREEWVSPAIVVVMDLDLTDDDQQCPIECVSANDKPPTKARDTEFFMEWGIHCGQLF